MRIGKILFSEVVRDSDSLTFMELACLIAILTEYIDKLKYERDCEENSLSDKEHNKISRKIKDAQNVLDKLQNIWLSRLIIK